MGTAFLFFAASAFALPPRYGRSCPMLFGKVSNIEVWGTARVENARNQLTELFRSSDGKLEGITLAAPKDPLGQYQFPWIRDNAASVYEIRDLPDVIEAYIKFCRLNLATKTLGSLGEPKFNPDGSAFNEPWGRPQNDGSAYRALRWMEYTEKKLADGNRIAALENYSPDLSQLSVKWDLEYITHHWKDPSFDLWEEEMGAHVHTRLMMHAALEKGAILAAKLEPGGENSGAARTYRAQAEEIKKSILLNAWNARQGYLRSTWQHDGGFVHKMEPLDIGVIIGLLHSTSGAPVFRMSDERVLSTMERLENRFLEIYRFNQRFQDPRFRGVVALGRYAEDRFHGGNPWVIATQAAGEFYYRLATTLLDEKQIVFTSVNHRFFTRLLGGEEKFKPRKRILSGEPEFSKIIEAIVEKANGFAEVVHSVTKGDGFHAEQFGRGYQPGDAGDWVAEYLKAMESDGSKPLPGGDWIGARLLVWNEASFSSFWRARNAYLEKAKSLQGKF